MKNIREQVYIKRYFKIIKNISLFIMVMILSPISVMAAPMVINVGSNQPIVTGGNPLVGQKALWVNAGTIDGVSIDLQATILEHSGGDLVLDTYLDMPEVWFNGGVAGSVKVRWEVFKNGTNQIVQAFGSPTFAISDIDGIDGNIDTRESVSPSLNNLFSYELANPTNLISDVVSGAIKISGTQEQSGEENSAVKFTWEDVSAWDITYTMYNDNGAGFSHDGSGTFSFLNSSTTILLILDLDADDSTSVGTGYMGSYIIGSVGVPIVDTDNLITQDVALGTDLGSATITLTNAHTNDLLTVGTLPSGIVASVDTSVSGKVIVTLTGNASATDYQTALKAVTFSNTDNSTSISARNFEVFVTDDVYGTNSRVTNSILNLSIIPDYIPTLNVRGTIIPQAQGELDFVVRVGEFNGGLNSDGDLSFTIEKSSAFILSFDTTKTIQQEKNLENNLWNLVETANTYSFTYIGNSKIFTAKSVSHIGLTAIYNTPNNKGTFSLEVTVNGGTSESNVDNNKDIEFIEYNN